MKKKTTYYQAVCYTTDHCDDDLIAPSFWNPTKDRKEAASEIMKEIKESFSYAKPQNGIGPDSITIEFRHNTDDNNSWESKVVKSMGHSKKFLTMLEQGLADGSIITVMVTVPEYVNLCDVLINERKDVFHINSLALST